MALIEMEFRVAGHVLRRRRRARLDGGRGRPRLNRNRLAQIRATGSNEVGVACPFCMIMLEDAKGALGVEELLVRDVAEIVAEALVTETVGPMSTTTPTVNRKNYNHLKRRKAWSTGAP